MGESDLPACGSLGSSAVTPSGFVHKSSDDDVGAVEEMMCVSVTEGA